MTDRYGCFAELAANEREGADFRIVIAARRSPVAVIAPHGGGIEPTTSELAAAIAGDDHSVYCFESLHGHRDHGDLHIASDRFDEPQGLALVRASLFAVAVHGRANGDDGDRIWMGGRDAVLIKLAVDALEGRGFKALVGSGALEGKSQANICNAGTSGRGLQLELPRGLRDELAGDPKLMASFASAVRDAIDRRLAQFGKSREPGESGGDGH
jgi:phage replication-related protein YjqB (UPF0714/DUF867 family)